MTNIIFLSHFKIVLHPSTVTSLPAAKKLPNFHNAEAYMNNLNSVLIEGNMVRDPLVRSTPKGTQVCNFSIA